MIPEAINEEAMQQIRVRITLWDNLKKFAFTNDIQKMFYLVLKYANIEFDFDRELDPPKRIKYMSRIMERI